MFGRKPAAQHVIGVGHKLHTQTFKISVQFACGQVHSLSGLKRHNIQVERTHNAYVAGVEFREAFNPARLRKLTVFSFSNRGRNQLSLWFVGKLHQLSKKVFQRSGHSGIYC